MARRRLTTFFCIRHGSRQGIPECFGLAQRADEGLVLLRDYVQDDFSRKNPSKRMLVHARLLIITILHSSRKSPYVPFFNLLSEVRLKRVCALTNSRGHRQRDIVYQSINNSKVSRQSAEPLWFIQVEYALLSQSLDCPL